MRIYAPLILNLFFIGILCSMAGTAHAASFMSQCVEAVSTFGDKAGGTLTGLLDEKKIGLLQSRLEVLKREIGPHDPFGVQFDSSGNYSQKIIAVFQRHGVDWKAINRMARKLNETGGLSVLEWQSLRTVANQAISQCKAAVPTDVESQSVQRILLVRLLEIANTMPRFVGSSSSQDKSKNKKGKKGENSENQTAQKQQSKSAASGSPQQNAASNESKTRKSESVEQKSIGPQESAANNDKVASRQGQKDGVPTVLNPEPIPNDSKSRYQFVSLALLRYLYRLELQKYDSADDLKNGLQSYFSFIENTAKQIESGVLNQFRQLVLAQIQALASDDLRHRTLTDFINSLRQAEGRQDTEELYARALGLLRPLNELAKYQALTPEESALVQKLQALVTSLQVDASDNVDVVTKRFFRQLIGDLSRSQMQEDFGPNLLESGSLAQKKFFDAIMAGKLWPYKYMSLLQPYLDFPFQPAFTFTPSTNPYGEFSNTAQGPVGIRRTDDMSLVDRFVSIEPRQMMMLNIAEGAQPFYQSRKPVVEPLANQKAIKKVSFILSDVSTSLKNFAVVRNMLASAYVDYYTSELKPVSPEVDQADNVASHIIYAANFTSEIVGEPLRIETKDQAAQFQKSITLKPDDNLDGDTNLQKVILQALDLVAAAHSHEDDDMQYAEITMFTDGADDAIDARAILNRIEEIERAHHSRVKINIIFIHKQNEILKDVLRKQAAQSDFKAGDADPVSLKFISDTDMNQISATARAIVSEPAVASMQTIERDGRERDLKRAVEDVVQALVDVEPETRRLIARARHIKTAVNELFGSEKVPEPQSRATLAKARKIVQILDEGLDHFSSLDLAIEARAGFVDQWISELCAAEGLDRNVFERALTDASFTRTRARFELWLNGK